MGPSKSKQNFWHDLAMVSKKPYMIFGMIFKILHEIGNLGRAARFDGFPTDGTFYGLGYVT